MIAIAKVGRKPKYDYWLTDEGLEKIKACRAKGLKIEEIAEKVVHTNVSTLYAWAAQFPEINEALKDGNKTALETVENALFKAATEGFNTIEVTTEERNGVVIGTKKTKKHQPPSVSAMIFYLKNRGNGEWRDNPIEQATDKEIKITLDWGDTEQGRKKQNAKKKGK